MKLSLKELKEIKNNLPVESEIFKKVCKEINEKMCQVEIKKAEKLMKLSEQNFKVINEMFNFKKGTLSDLNIEDNETLGDLVNDISAIKEVQYNTSCHVPYNVTVIVVDFNDLKEGEFDRIIRVKNKHIGYYIKSIH